MIAPLERFSAEEFVDTRFELPENGRWTQLVRGQVETLVPPDDDHGNVVRNLANAFSEYAHRTDRGYACFDLGLVVRRQPDTVRFPPACYFMGGTRFAETDNFLANSKPVLVVEIASTNDRRRQMEQVLTEYLDWGVPLAWVIDPDQKMVHTFQPGKVGRKFTDRQQLSGGTLLEGFEISIADLFVLPTWWNEKT